MQFVAAGADGVVFHIEAVSDPRPLLDALHRQGAAAGLAYNPDTPVTAVLGHVEHCDMVLTMSVSPGFGGQAFNPVALDNLRTLKAHSGQRVLLEVDGGVNESTIAACTAAGAQLCVVGSAIFKQPDYSAAVTRLTELAQTGSRSC
jgi:ribulose-phosphate 3-epimerase